MRTKILTFVNPEAPMPEVALKDRFQLLPEDRQQLKALPGQSSPQTD